MAGRPGGNGRPKIRGRGVARSAAVGITDSDDDGESGAELDICMPMKSYYTMWLADPRTFFRPPKASLQIEHPQALQAAGMSDMQWSKLRSDVEAAFEPVNRNTPVLLLWPLSSIAYAVLPLAFMYIVYNLYSGLSEEESKDVPAIVNEWAVTWFWVISWVLVRRVLLPRALRLSRNSCHEPLKQICVELNASFPSLNFSADYYDAIAYNFTSMDLPPPVPVSAVAVPVSAVAVPVAVMAVPVVFAVAVTAVPVVAVAARPVEAQPAEELNWEAQDAEDM